MKKFFRFLLAAVVLSSGAISCSDDDPTPDGPTPGPGPTPGDEVRTIAQSPEGVSLIAYNITEKDFDVRTEMGDGVVTYRFDVMPLAKFYNLWMEARKKKPDMSEDEFIINRLVRNDGTGGYQFKSSIDLTWGESIYKQAAMIQSFDYVVLAVGCIDDMANTASEPTKLVVPLKKVEPVGDPRAMIDLTADYRKFYISYTMNDECHAFYQLSVPPEHYSEVNVFFNELKEQGEDIDPDIMMRDLICCFDASPSEENWKTGVDFKFAATPETEIVVLTVGLDAAGTPSYHYEKAQTHLATPKDLPAAEYSVELKWTSATTALLYFDANFEVTGVVYNRLLSAHEWKRLQDSVARGDMTWYQYSVDLALNGDGMNDPEWKKTRHEWQMLELAPESDYVMVSCAQNKEIALTDPIGTPFRTKAIHLDTPTPGNDLNITVSNIQRTSFTANYEIPEGMAVFYERIMEEGFVNSQGIDLTNEANYETYTKRFVRGADGNVNSMFAPRKWTYAGLTPATNYYHFYIAEDQNGNVSDLKVAKFTSSSNDGGKNPEVQIRGEVTKLSDGSYQWNVYYTGNADVHHMRYCIDDQTFDEEDMTEEEKISAWTDLVIGGSGMETVNLTPRLTTVVTKYSTKVALAYPYGEVKEDGTYTQGKLAYYLFDPATIQSSMLKQVRPFVVPPKDQYKRIPVL